MTDELHILTLTIDIEPTALTLLQQQAGQQGVTLDQLAARYIGCAAAQAETHAGHIRAANAFNGLVLCGAVWRGLYGGRVRVSRHDASGRAMPGESRQEGEKYAERDSAPVGCRWQGPGLWAEP